MRRILNENRKIIIYTTIILLFYVLFFTLFLKKPFIVDNDQWFQYNHFYKEWANLICDFLKGKGFPFYSWNSYLGSDFFSSMGYYCTGNIFLPLLLIFRNNIYLYSIIETILCVYISVFLMYIFLKKYGIKKESVVILISLIYGFGGTAVIYCGDYMFHRFYAFIPLALIGLLDFFDNNRFIIFSISIFILFLQNYYLMWPFSIFIFIFCLLEEKNRNRNIKSIFCDFVKLFISYLIGLLMSAIITLPAMTYIINSTRVGTSGNTELLWPLNTYFSILANTISINPSGYIYTTASALSDDGHVYSYNIMIGLIPLVSSLSYITNKNNRHYLIALIVLTLSIIFKPLCSALHGFSVPSFRWLVILNLLLLIISAKALDCEKNSKKERNILFAFIVILLLTFVGCAVNGSVDFNKQKIDLLIKLFSLIMGIFAFIVYIKNEKIAYYITIAIFLLSSFEMLYYQTKDSKLSEDRIDKEVIRYVDSTSDELVYRYYIPYSTFDPGIFLQMNESLYYGYMSTSTYSSVVEPIIYKFNEENGFSDWQIEISDPNSLSMLGVKYLVFGPNDKRINNYNLKYITNLDYYQLYENEDYQGFARTMDSICYTNKNFNLNNISNTLFIDDEEIDISKYSNIDSQRAVILEKGNNYIKGEIAINNDNILLIPIPNNEGWKILLNGEEVSSISVNNGFIGLPLSQGTNNFEMYFIPKYFKSGATLSCSGIFCLLIAVLLTNRKKTHEKQ